MAKFKHTVIDMYKFLKVNHIDIKLGTFRQRIQVRFPASMDYGGNKHFRFKTDPRRERYFTDKMTCDILSGIAREKLGSPDGLIELIDKTFGMQ